MSGRCTDPRGSDRRVTGLVVCLALALAALAAGCTPATPSGAGSAGSAPVMTARLAPAGVWWADGGKLVVAANLGADGRPTVTVWDPATGDKKVLGGMRVVAVEPDAARAWVVPADTVASVDNTATFPVDLAGDGVDGPPTQLQLLDLTTGKATDATDARWQRWDGPGKLAVYPEIDINRGGLPSALWFNTPKPQGDGSKITLPGGVVSLDLAAWSPSGTYFAVVSAVPVNDAEGKMRAFVTADAGTPWPTGDGRVLVFRASDAAIVTSVPIRMRIYDTRSGAARVAWDGKRDVLWVLGVGADGAGVGTVAPGGAMKRQTKLADGLRGLDLTKAWFAGSSPDGADLTDGSQAFLLANGQATSAAKSLVGDRFLPKSGTVSIAAKGASGYEVTVTAPDGATQTLAVPSSAGK